MYCGGPCTPGGILSSTIPRRWSVWLPSSMMRSVMGPAEIVCPACASTISMLIVRILHSYYKGLIIHPVAVKCAAERHTLDRFGNHPETFRVIAPQRVPIAGAGHQRQTWSTGGLRRRGVFFGQHRGLAHDELVLLAARAGDNLVTHGQLVEVVKNVVADGPAYVSDQDTVAFRHVGAGAQLTHHKERRLPVHLSHTRVQVQAWNVEGVDRSRRARRRFRGRMRMADGAALGIEHAHVGGIDYLVCRNEKNDHAQIIASGGSVDGQPQVGVDALSVQGSVSRQRHDALDVITAEPGERQVQADRTARCMGRVVDGDAELYVGARLGWVLKLKRRLG